MTVRAVRETNVSPSPTQAKVTSPLAPSAARAHKAAPARCMVAISARASQPSFLVTVDTWRLGRVAVLMIPREPLNNPSIMADWCH